MVAPPDEFERRVSLAHGFGEIEGCSDGLLQRKGAIAAVGYFVTELSELQVEGLRGAVLFAFFVVGIVGIGYPVSGFARVAGAIALAGVEEAHLAIASEVYSIEGLGAYAPAELDELVGSNAVGLLSAPEVVAYGRAFGGQADSLSPFIVAAEKAAEAHRAGRKVFHGVDEVFAPIVATVIPASLDGAIGHAARFHEPPRLQAGDEPLLLEPSHTELRNLPGGVDAFQPCPSRSLYKASACASRLNCTLLTPALFRRRSRKAKPAMGLQIML